MSERLSRERLEVLERAICDQYLKSCEDCRDPEECGHAIAAQLRDHIAALVAENERLRAALRDCIQVLVVFDTDTDRIIAIEHVVNAALEVGE